MRNRKCIAGKQAWKPKEKNLGGFCRITSLWIERVSLECPGNNGER